MSIPAGTKVDRYVIESAIGAGSMGDVLLGHDADLNRKAAIKILSEKHRDNQELQGRFSREGRAVAAISHPNVVQVFATGNYGGRPFIAMEFLRGEDLQTLVKSKGALTSQRAAEIAAQTARGLEAAAVAGLIHRDVKPANLILLDSGTVKVTDFGLAKPKDPRDEPALTALGVVVGTPDYIAPEQARGDPLDERVDIYALGGTLYYLVTGVPPFRKGNPADDKYLKVVARHLRDPAPDPRGRVPGVDPELSNLILQLMSKEPADRPSYPQLISRLEAIARRLAQGPQGVAYSGKKHPSQPAPTPFVGGMHRDTGPVRAPGGTDPGRTMVQTPTAERRAASHVGAHGHTGPGAVRAASGGHGAGAGLEARPSPAPAPPTSTPVPGPPGTGRPPVSGAPHVPSGPHTPGGGVPRLEPGAVTMRSEPGTQPSPLAAAAPPITRPPQMPPEPATGAVSPPSRKSGRLLLVLTVVSAGVLAVGLGLKVVGSDAPGAAGAVSASDAAVPLADAAPVDDAAPTVPEPPEGMAVIHRDGAPWFFVATLPVSRGQYLEVFPRQKPGGGSADAAVTRVSRSYARSFAEARGKRLPTAEELRAAREAGAIAASGLDEWTADTDDGRPVVLTPSGKTRVRRDRGRGDITFRLVLPLPGEGQQKTGKPE